MAKSKPILSRLSASLLVLRSSTTAREGFQVLMVQRSRSMKFASAMWAFPGGVYDSDGDGDGSVKDGMELSTDVETLRSCALREAFEETGILPLKPGATLETTATEWKRWRTRVHDHGAQWHAFQEQVLGSRTLFGPCLSYCCFLTPEFEAKRGGRQYLTHFFACEINSKVTGPWDKVVTDDNETVNHAWVSPSEALRRNHDGSMKMFPPQSYILSRMCMFKSVADAMAASSWFCKPRPQDPLALVMQPQLVDMENFILALPFDQDYKGQYKGVQGAYHRVKASGKMELQLNDLASEKLCGKARGYKTRSSL